MMAGAMDRPVRAAADFRLVRAAVFAAVCVLLSALGHGVASGMSVEVRTLAAGWLAVMCVVVPLAGRRRSLRGITTGLAVGQLALHLMFCLAQCTFGPGDSATPRASGVMALAARLVCGGLPAGTARYGAAHLVQQAGLTPAQAVARSLGGAPMPGMGSSGSPGVGMNLMLTPAMVTAHLVAALLLGLLLWRGDAALWRLVRCSGRVLGPVLVAVAAALRAGFALLAGLGEGARRAARADRWRVGPCRPGPAAVRHSVVRRGPPAVVGAV
jgi:hypothetical protein